MPVERDSNTESGPRGRSGTLEGIRVSILGLGASGKAAARLVLNKGGTVYVSDLRAESPVAAAGDELSTLGADVELGGHDVDRISVSDLVVVSPGIPPNAPVLRELRTRGVSWVSEPELAFRFFRSPLIAVTGTNGKTTTAVLTAHLIRAGGLEVGLGGNIGGGLGPAASELALMEPAPDWLVVEVSSFQLSAIREFSPDIGILTNLAPDHLDWYADVGSYYADKANLFRNAREGSRWVLDGDDPAVEALAGEAPGIRFRVSLDSPRHPGGWLADDMLVMDLGEGDVPLIDSEELPLVGRHNRANALFAAVAAGLAGVRVADLRRGLASAPSVPHRLERVTERGGVEWIDDSKATNVAAAMSAVRSLDGALVILLGGKDKGEDFGPLASLLAERHEGGGLRAAIVYGAARNRILQALRTRGVPGHVVDGPFESVVAMAESLARPGDRVLLAPACSSFDMFLNYQARGDRFAALARGEA
jgi:UDP-N-acetylmuramoylalanine--D-glutamate ligase